MGQKQFVKKTEQAVVKTTSWVVLACIMAALVLGTFGVYAQVRTHESGHSIPTGTARTGIRLRGFPTWWIIISSRLPTPAGTTW
jgi:hypothetical protein